MTDRIVSLSALASGAEQYTRLFMDLSELARNLTDDFQHVSVTASRVDEDDSEPLCDPDGLYHDEQTLVKVREAIKRGLGERVWTARDVLTNAIVTEIITEMQNAGILFREKR